MNSRPDEFTQKKFIEDEKTIMELSGRLQELQNEVKCTNDSRDFKDAESVRSGISHVPSQPVLMPRYRDPGGMLCRKDKWQTFGIRMVGRETFL